jgi:hypothetical protein
MKAGGKHSSSVTLVDFPNHRRGNLKSYVLFWILPIVRIYQNHFLSEIGSISIFRAIEYESKPTLLGVPSRAVIKLPEHGRYNKLQRWSDSKTIVSSNESHQRQTLQNYLRKLEYGAVIHFLAITSWCVCCRVNKLILKIFNSDPVELARTRYMNDWQLAMSHLHNYFFRPRSLKCVHPDTV